MANRKEKPPNVIIHDNDPIQLNTSFLFEQYKVLSDRRINHNQLFWGVPPLFLSAQAFLFIIELGSTSEWWARAVAAFVSVIFGVLSIQAFERHRIMEITDAEQLLDIEQKIIKIGFLGNEIHKQQMLREYLDGSKVNTRLANRKQLNYFNKISSHNLYIFGMWLTTIISSIIFISVLLYQIPELTPFFQKQIHMEVLILLFFSIAFNVLLIMFLYMKISQKSKTLVFSKTIFLFIVLLNLASILTSFLISLSDNIQLIHIVINTSIFVIIFIAAISICIKLFKH